jgi:hypothetical protein
MSDDLINGNPKILYLLSSPGKVLRKVISKIANLLERNWVFYVLIHIGVVCG